MIALLLLTLLLCNSINSEIVENEFDLAHVIVVNSHESEQLEAHKDSHNDLIISKIAIDEYSRLKWFSFGFPKLLETTINNETNVFHFTSRGFYTFIETLTLKHRMLLAEEASSKYNIQIKPSQIEFLPLSQFTCAINLQSGNKETRILGEVSQFKKLPLRMDFSAPRNTFERRLINEQVECGNGDIILKCEIATKGREVKNTLKIAPRIMNQFQIVDDLFGPDLTSVFITKVQMNQLAEKLYDKMDILREFKMPEFEFKKLFVNDFIRQTSEGSFKQQSLATVVPLLSNFSLDTDLDLNSIEIEIEKYLKVEDSKFITVNTDGIDELTDRHLLTRDDNGDLIFMGILVLSTANANQSDCTGMRVNEKSLKEQLSQMNSATTHEFQWELKGETIGIKSISVAKLQRNSFSKTLVFNDISRRFHETPLKQFPLYTSAPKITKNDYEMLLDKVMETRQELDLEFKRKHDDIVSKQTEISNRIITIENNMANKSSPLSVFNGLNRNKPLSDFTNRGFSVVYDYLYEHWTNESEINAIRNECTESSMLCVGGYDTHNPSILLLVACGDCLQITQTTPKNSPVFHKGVYWYYTPLQSFGFAPSSTITQWQADTYDMNDDNRLSWYICCKAGGYRLGSLIGLITSKRYRKIILKHG